MSDPVTITQRQSKLETVPIGLALGGGAARGIAHIPMAEAFDELGIRPQFIAGTSMGSIIGACYAGGMSGVEMREFAQEILDRRRQFIRRIYSNWSGKLSDLLNPLTPALVNAEQLLEIMMPNEVPRDFADLEIPFAAITTDFYTQQEYVIESGSLISAIAASSTLPALMKPVERDGRVLIDGGFVNPTPYDIVMERTPFTVAVDVLGVPGGDSNGVPGSIDTLVGATLIMLQTVMREKLKNQRPNVLIQPNVGHYRAMQFFKCDEILTASEPAKDELKRALEARLKQAA